MPWLNRPFAIGALDIALHTSGFYKAIALLLANLSAQYIWYPFGITELALRKLIHFVLKLRPPTSSN